MHGHTLAAMTSRRNFGHLDDSTKKRARIAYTEIGRVAKSTQLQSGAQSPLLSIEHSYIMGNRFFIPLSESIAFDSMTIARQLAESGVVFNMGGGKATLMALLPSNEESSDEVTARSCQWIVDFILLALAMIIAFWFLGKPWTSLTRSWLAYKK